MQAVKVADASQMTREEWLEARKNGIGGSEIAAIMGKNPWETPLSVYLRTTGMIEEKEQTEAMYFGVALEDFVANEFVRRTGHEVVKETHILAHPVYEFMLANVDRIVVHEDGNGVLECKNVSAYQADNWKDGAPEHYVYQLQWYLGITGLKYGFIAALIGGQKFAVFQYDRDDSLIDEMHKAASDFWFNHVMEKVQPDISANDGDVLDQMFNEPSSDLVAMLTEQNFDLMKQAVMGKANKELAENIYNEAVNKIKNYMGNAETLTWLGETVATWKANKKGVRMFKLKVGE